MGKSEKTIIVEASDSSAKCQDRPRFGRGSAMSGGEFIALNCEKTHDVTAENASSDKVDLELTTLDKLKPGERGVITSVGGEDELRLRLLDMGVIPRTAVEVVKIAPMGDPVEIRLRDYELTLRLASAALVEIVKFDEDSEKKAGEKI